MNKLLISVAAVAVLVFAGLPAKADIMFFDKDIGGVGETNILFNANDSSVPLLGQIDHSGVDAAFTSLTGQSLISSGNGQADIQANPDPGTTKMTSIEMTAATGTAWTDAIINLDDASNPCGGGSNTCGTAEITAVDNLGNKFTTDVLQNGNNFVSMVAGPDSHGTMEFITQIQVTEFAAGTSPFGWTDFKQPRVSGLCTLVPGTDSCTPIPTSVPAPGPLGLLLLGGVLTVGGWYYRRTKNNA